MSFGTRFVGVDPSSGSGNAAPFGQCGAVITKISENDKGTVELEMDGIAPDAYKSKVLKDWFKLGAEAKSDKHQKTQERIFTGFLKACGFADFALDPSLVKTHKNLISLTDIQMLVGRKVLVDVGQYISAKGYTNNEMTGYHFPNKPPMGVTVPQPAPRQSQGGSVNNSALPNSGFAGPSFGQPDFGDEPIPHLPDGAGMAATDDNAPPF